MMRNGNQLRNRKRAAGRCLPFPWPLVPGPRSLSWFTIRGGLPLHGEVRAAGSKNAALPMMAAAILADEPVTLERVPQLADVQTLARVLESLGMAVTRRDGTLRLETADPRPVQAPWRLVRRLRASFCVLGPLLARRGRAVVPLPGGCRIGDRPVDLHLKGLAALGADLRLEHGCVVARAEAAGGRDHRPPRPARPHRDRHRQRAQRRRAGPRQDAPPRGRPGAGNRRPGRIAQRHGGADRRPGDRNS